MIAFLVTLLTPHVSLPPGCSPPQCFPCSVTFISISPTVLPGRLVPLDVTRVLIKKKRGLSESGMRLCEQIGLADTVLQPSYTIVFAAEYPRTFTLQCMPGLLKGAVWLVAFPTYLITECCFVVLLEDGFLGHCRETLL